MDLQGFKADLLNRVDIVDVVERRVTLKKAGANYSACCPFHSEKTPSFTVSPSKQFYHCFGCGAHGNAIDFVMQMSGLEFMEALEELAQTVGMQLPRFDPRSTARKEEKVSLAEMMGQAAAFYRAKLRESPKAIEYLKRRGLTGEIANRFGLGYAPDDWQGLQSVFPRYQDPALAECGLVIDNDQGRRYDRFRDRIMFPILDSRNRVIGFGGRVIGDGEPKYLNSPETALFVKGQEVYGLPQARQAIHGADCIIVVEGYMDVVGLAQLGVENVVASLGTAMTGQNVRRLLKLSNRLVFCFDRDKAGDRAARRAMENSLEFLEDGKSVEILQMPGDQDPDEYIREHGRAAFDKLVKSGTTRLSEFLVREVRKPAGEGIDKQFDLSTAEGRAQLVGEAKPLLQRISATILRVQLTKEIATLAGLSQAELEAQCGLKPLARSRGYALPPRQRQIEVSALRVFLKCVLRQPLRAARLPLAHIPDEGPEGAALHAIARAYESGELAAGNLAVLLEHFRASAHEGLLNALAAKMDEAADEADEEKEFTDTLVRLQETERKARITALTAKERREGLDGDEKRELTTLLTARKTA